MFELIHGEIGGSAAAEINEIRLAAADEGLGGINLQLGQQGIEVSPNRGRIFISINLEITKMAALPAERDVSINPERSAGSGWAVNRGEDFRRVLRFPEGIGWIIRDEIVSDRRFLLQRNHGFRRRRRCNGAHVKSFTSSCLRNSTPPRHRRPRLFSRKPLPESFQSAFR